MGAEEFQQIVRGADHLPFRLHFLQPAQQKSPKPSCLFDLPKNRFHHRLAQFIDRLSFRRPQLVPQLLGHAGPRGGGPVVRGCFSLYCNTVKACLFSKIFVPFAVLLNKNGLIVETAPRCYPLMNTAAKLRILLPSALWRRGGIARRRGPTFCGGGERVSTAMNALSQICIGRHGFDPSPARLDLVKTPVASHPLPQGARVVISNQRAPRLPRSGKVLEVWRSLLTFAFCPLPFDFHWRLRRAALLPVWRYHSSISCNCASVTLGSRKYLLSAVARCGGIPSALSLPSASVPTVSCRWLPASPPPHDHLRVTVHRRLGVIGLHKLFRRSVLHDP